MKRFRLYISSRLRHGMAVVALAAILLGLLTYRLHMLTKGLAGNEQPILSSHNILQLILHNPLFLPLQLLRLIVSFTPFHSVAAARAPSAAIGFATLLAFAYLARLWYGARTMFFSLLLLAAAPWFLHVSRLATNDILYPFTIICLLLLYTLSQRSESSLWWWLSPIAGGILLYIPGSLWFVMLGFVWQSASYRQAWRAHAAPFRALWLLLWPITAGLLVYAFWHAPHLVYAWAGIPQHFSHPIGIAENAGRIWRDIFVRGPQQPLTGLGYLPLINIFTTAMALAGCIFYAKHWRASRSRMLLACLAVSTVLAALNSPVSSAVLMPFVFILAAGGLAYLLHEWFRVFPRNPLAKAVGYGFLSLAVAFSVFYNLRQYFIAWPHAAATRSVFRRRL